MFPLDRRALISSGFAAGLLNTFCYVGSTLSTALLGYIADHGSWDRVFLCLLLFGAVACVACLCSVLVEKRHPVLTA